MTPLVWNDLLPHDHILRWAWRTHPYTRDRVRGVLAVAQRPVVVRLRSHPEVRGWLSGPVRIAAQAAR